ncbi:MAG: IclR family transcriptional regulator C-terminal domain-containing protein [Roseiarcus sp.]
MSSDARGVQSIEVGWRLLEALIAEGGPMMLRNIAKVGGIAPAQAHPYLVSYRKSNLVVQDRSSGQYRIGHMAIQLGLSRLRSFDPFQAVNESACKLACETGLTIAVVAWGNYGPTVVQVNEGADQILIKTRPGTVFSVTGTATGRIYAAFLPRELIVTSIKYQKTEGHKVRYVGETPDLRDIQDKINFIRRHGYSPIESTPIPGINAVSAPIFDLNGQLTMAATLIGAKGVLDGSPGSPRIKQRACEGRPKGSHSPCRTMIIPRVPSRGAAQPFASRP